MKKKPEPVINYELPNREWYTTMYCCCGECRFKNPKRCPKEGEPGGIWLYASRPRQ